MHLKSRHKKGVNVMYANGGAKWDHSALVKALERMANHEVAGAEK